MQEKGRNELYLMSVEQILYELYNKYEYKLQERTGKLISRQRVESVMKETHQIQFEQEWRTRTGQLQEELHGKQTLGKVRKLRFEYAEELRIKEELGLHQRAKLDVYQDIEGSTTLYLVVDFRGYERLIKLEKLDHESVQTAVTINYRRNSLYVDYLLKREIPDDLEKQVVLGEILFS